MATPLYNRIFLRLPLLFVLMRILTTVDSTETVPLSASTTFPTTHHGMEQQFTTTILPDSGLHDRFASNSSNYELQQPVTTPSTDYTTLLLTSSSDSSNTTELQSTSSPVEERIELSTSHPISRNEGLSPFNNVVTSRTTCTNSSVNVHLKFSRPFLGFAYAKKSLYNASCNVFALPSATAKEFLLELPFDSCNNKLRPVDSGVLVYNTIIIQQHQMILTRYDKVLNVSCVVENASVADLRPSEGAANNTNEGDVLPGRTRSRKAVAWLEVVIGSDLFDDEEAQPPNFIESALYMVIKVADSRRHRDMIVRNCIAHDRRLVTSDANLYQMSDFYGCPSNLSALEGFVVTNRSGQHFDLMGYARIRNFTLFAQGQLFITCGVNLCPEVCNPKCDRPISERFSIFSRVVMKKIVRRAMGATTPATLNLHTDDTEARAKRSIVSDTINNVYSVSRSFLSELFKGEFPTPGTIEFSTSPKTFPTDSDQTEPTSASDETTLSPIVETIAVTEALENETSTEVFNNSSRIHKLHMVINLKNKTVYKRKIHTISSYASPDSFPSELFVVAVFVLMVGSYLCVVHSRSRKMNRVVVYK